MIKFTQLTVILFIVLSSNAQNQNPEKIDTITVSVTRSISKLENLPINVSFITKNEIEELQPLTATEALKSIPGITLQSDGGLTSTPIIRGLSRERAPVLIDGNSFVGGRIRTFALIDPFQIERIEVIKGPASAFWGSDAVGGLINIITRKAESGFGKDFKIGSSLYSGYQSVNTHKRGRLEVEGRGKGIDFLIGGGLRDAENTKTPSGEIPNSQFESQYLDWNIGYSPKQNHRFEISGKYFKNDNVGFPGGLGAPGPPVRIRLFAPDVQTGINFSYNATKLSNKIEALGVNVYSKWQRLHIDMITNVFFEGTMDPNRIIHPNLDVDVNFGGAKGFIALRLNKNNKLTLGADYLREYRKGTYRELVIDVYNRNGDQVNHIAPPAGQIQPDSYSNSYGLFAIEELKINEALDLLVALRIDNIATRIESEPFYIPEIADLFNDQNSSSNNTALTGNIGLKYHFTTKMDASINLANSFRGPDLFSKYNFADGVIPNPDLDPENGVFYELNYNYKNLENLSFNVSFYQNFLSDLFVPVNVTFEDTPAIQNQNVGKAKLTGWEYLLAYNFNANFNGFWTGSYIRGKDQSTNENLDFMPADQNALGLRFKDNNQLFFGQIEGVFTSKQDRNAPSERKTDAYSLFNINTGVHLHRLFSKLPYSKLMLSIDNVFDKDYQSHVFRGVPGNQTRFSAPGRSINMLLIIKLGAASSRLR
ncbi:TonB-dependent receptor plug domain-containing protein [Geojedonia litorea]|uniref:TonB-dependent receptor plug domain-containing protein n=1 Tax=Geojedonia litorea TaxID=1268269 RepID=A0ABV9N3X2_9FLAO